MKEIYLSSISLSKKLNLEEIIRFSKRHKINFEFSSGIGHHENADQLLIDSELKCYTHNYFPAPKNPFVLNLASTNEQIREMSINHCINGLNLSNKIRAKFFSAHAGFCLDPDPHELGAALNVKKNFDKNKHFSLFVESIERILTVAKKNRIKFLIENNVLTNENYINKINPLFAVSSSQILEIFSKIKDNNFGLLFDTGHFKVSAETLSFDIDKEFKKINHLVEAIHHSDNDGKSDTNSRLGDDYWFKKYLKKTKNLLHVIEVKNLEYSDINEQLNYIAGGLE